MIGYKFSDMFGEYEVVSGPRENEHGPLWDVRTPEGPLVSMYEPAIFAGCIAEFGPHDTHDECQATLANMSAADNYSPYNEDTWYANRGAQGMGF
jgi:hypothetical protein